MSACLMKMLSVQRFGCSSRLSVCRHIQLGQVLLQTDTAGTGPYCVNRMNRSMLSSQALVQDLVLSKKSSTLCTHHVFNLHGLFRSRIHKNQIAAVPNVWSRSISENRETKTLTVWSDLGHIRSSPFPALVLGFSGLIPFVGAPAFMIMSSAYLPWVVYAQTAYGAAILSFLGGVRWGFTLPEGSPGQPDWRSLSYSVVPSLIGWGALLCPEPVSSLTVMSGLVGLAYFDTTMYGYPPWFKALRFVLSTFAVMSLWTSFVCRFILNKKQADSANLPK